MADEIIIKDSDDKRNPFNLDNKKITGGKKTVTLSKVYTEEEQAKMLEYFLEVPLEMLCEVRKGAFVRYRLKSGEFRLGGYVSANPIASYDKITNLPQSYIKLEIGAPKTPAYKTWMVKHQDISNLYVQQSLPTILANKMIKDSVNKLNSNIKKLNDRLERLERKILR
jgi:hypothetical protein